jgi:staphylococcal nuclease domain-containing protein 1
MTRKQEEAKRKRIGIHAPGKQQSALINDLSSKPNRQKSAAFLHYVQNKRSRGILEYFASATRVVVLVPDHHCLMRINLLGLVSCDPKERIGNEAQRYCQTNYLMRDVELYISDVDRIGLFLGNIGVLPDSGKPKCLEADLLAHGFTKIHQGAVGKCPNRREMEDAERKARAEQIGVWSPRNSGVVPLEKGKVYEVRAIELFSPIEIAVQLQSVALRNVVTGLAQAKQPVGHDILRNDLVCVVSDGKWCRARVLGADKETASVRLLDLAVDEEKVALADIRALPPELSSIPPQGILVRLGGVRGFRLDEEFAQAAMTFLWDLVKDAALHMHLMYEGDVPDVLLTDEPSVQGGSVNAMLLAEGFVSALEDEMEPPFDDVLRSFIETEAQAKRERKGAWVHGNIGNDDDDEEGNY